MVRGRASLGVATATLAMLLFVPSVIAAPFWDLPASSSPQMDLVRTLYDRIFWVALAIFILVEGWLLYTVLRFGPKGSGKESREHERGNTRAEIAWTIAPALILLWVGIMSFGTLNEIEAAPTDADAVEVDIIGHQWFWEWRYPNGVRINALDWESEDTFFHVPVDTVILLNVTADDVIHSVGVREFNLKIDAVPGHPNQQWFRATEPGTYLLQCQEYCGLFHGYMRGQILVESRVDYEDWLAEKLKEQTPEPPKVSFNMSMTDDGVEPSELFLIVGTNVTLKITNDGTTARAFKVDAPIDETTDAIEPGETATVRFLVEEPFEADFGAADPDDRAAGIKGTVRAVEAETIDVDLYDFGITLSKTSFEAGKTYLFRVKNSGDVVHNLYGGTWARASAEKETVFKSPDLGPGETAEVFWTARADAKEVWCDVPGHYQLGMHVNIQVSG